MIIHADRRAVEAFAPTLYCRTGTNPLVFLVLSRYSHSVFGHRFKKSARSWFLNGGKRREWFSRIFNQQTLSKLNIKEELLIVLGTSSSEPVLPRMMENMGAKKTTVGLVIPKGYSFNLDGTSIYLTMARCSLHRQPTRRWR